MLFAIEIRGGEGVSNLADSQGVNQTLLYNHIIDMDMPNVCKLKCINISKNIFHKLCAIDINMILNILLISFVYDYMSH